MPMTGRYFWASAEAASSLGAAADGAADGAAAEGWALAIGEALPTTMSSKIAASESLL
jgi:hypothetical protein